MNLRQSFGTTSLDPHVPSIAFCALHPVVTGMLLRGVCGGHSFIATMSLWMQRLSRYKKRKLPPERNVWVAIRVLLM